MDTKKENGMDKVRIEIRAAEGGDDSKLLVKDQAALYAKTCQRRCF